MSFTKTLLQGTTSVHECLENSAVGAPREARWLAEGFRESCNSLGDLLIDTEFSRFIHGLQGKTIGSPLKLQSDFDQLSHRMEEFLAAEKELFQRAGLPVSASDHLIQRCREIIVQRRFSSVPDVVLSLNELQSYVCEKAELVEAGRRRSILIGMRDVFGGLTTAALNGGLLAATVGLTGALAVGSITIGGVIAADGYMAVRRLY